MGKAVWVVCCLPTCLPTFAWVGCWCFEDGVVDVDGEGAGEEEGVGALGTIYINRARP